METDKETARKVEATATVILKNYFAGKLRTKPVYDKRRDYLRVCAFTCLIITAYYTETQERFNDGWSYADKAIPLIGDTVARLFGEFVHYVGEQTSPSNN